MEVMKQYCMRQFLIYKNRGEIMRFERADKSVRGSIFINSNTIYWIPMDEKKIYKYDC